MRRISSMGNFFSYLSWFQILLIVVMFMSGVLSILREALLIHNKKINEKKLFWRSLWVTFVLSSLYLWCAEHYSVIGLHDRIAALSRPQLSASIDHTMVAKLMYGPNGRYSQRLITAFITVRNTGAPSVAEAGAAWLTLPNGKVVRALGFIGTGKNMVLPGARGVPTVVIDRNESFLSKEERGPVPRGGAVTGWLMYVVPYTLDVKDVTNSVMKIDFSDVNGKEFSCSRKLFLNKPPSNENWMFNPMQPPNKMNYFPKPK